MARQSLLAIFGYPTHCHAKDLGSSYDRQGRAYSGGSGKIPVRMRPDRDGRAAAPMLVQLLKAKTAECEVRFILAKRRSVQAMAYGQKRVGIFSTV